MGVIYIANTRKRSMIAAELVMNGYIVKQVRKLKNPNGKAYDYGLSIRNPSKDDRVVCIPRDTGDDD